MGNAELTATQQPHTARPTTDLQNTAPPHTAPPNTQSYLPFFQQRMVDMIAHWRDHEAVQTVEVATLDSARDSILKIIALGLDFEPAWPVVRPLLIAFTPYMERRGYWDAWHSLLQQAISAAQRLNDVDGETTLTALLARLCQRMSRPLDVVRYYRQVIRLARQSGNRFEEARACSNLGYFYIDGGRWWRSEALSCHALTEFKALESDHGQAHTHNHLGVLYSRQKRWQESEYNLHKARRIWQLNKDMHSLIYAHMNLGVLYIELQNTQRTLENLENAYRLALLTGETSNIASIWNNMAIAYRQSQKWVEAEQYAKKAEEKFREYSDLHGLASVWQNLGLILAKQEQTELAVRYFKESIVMHRQLGNSIGEKYLIKSVEDITALSEDDKAAIKS